MHRLGTHLLIELYGCQPLALNDPAAIEDSMREAAELAGATVVSSHANLFTPHGVNAVVLIAESHVTIHTWPEHRYAALDLFTCGQKVQPWRVQTFMQKALGAERCSAMEVRRGLFDIPLAHKLDAGPSQLRAASGPR